MRLQGDSCGIPSIGEHWPLTSRLWGEPSGRGNPHAAVSPIDGKCMQVVDLLDQAELQRLAAPARTPAVLGNLDLGALCSRLACALMALRSPLQEALQLETGFVTSDCAELIEVALAYVQGIPASLNSTPLTAPFTAGYWDGQAERKISIVAPSFGTIAAILPQNAFLLLALTCMLNGLAGGSRVILRAPLQSARSAAILAAALDMAELPRGLVSIAAARAREFLHAIYESPLPCLIHYMGASRTGAEVLRDGLLNGKFVLVDGDGNVWVYVDGNADVGVAERILTSGSLRYNGQTCTSVNGAYIHPDIYPALRARLLQRWSTLRAGDPRWEDPDVGPLFDEQQAEHCEERLRASGGKVLVGCRRVRALLSPTLVESPNPDSDLVREGIFGCGLWIAPGSREQFASAWPGNRYPLCAAVLSPDQDPSWLEDLPAVARLVLNGDPSVEHVFEPWGAYAGSGVNPVSPWAAKYRRMVQLDSRST